MSPNRERIVLEIQRARMPFLVLAALAAAALLAGWVIFRNLSFERPWQDYIQVQAAFQDVKGAAPGKQPVRISGVQVGVVKDWRVAGDHAVLTLSIERRHGRIYRDARMRLRPVTPLQDMYVDVDRGTPAAGVLGADEVLPADRTRTPVDISRVLNTFDAPTRQRLGLLLDGLGAGLEDRGAALRDAFTRLGPFLSTARSLGSALGERRRSTARLVTNLERLTATLATRNRQLTGLVRDGSTTLGVLADHDRDLDATLRELSPALRSLRTSFVALQRAEDELDPAIRSLGPVSARLSGGLSALRRFGDEAAPALAALEPAVRALRPLSQELTPTASGLRGAVAALRPQAPGLDRVTQRLLPCLGAAARFFQWTPSVIKFGDANGANPRADLTIGVDSLDGRATDVNQVRTARCTDAKGYPRP